MLNKIRKQEEQKFQTPVWNQQLNGVSELTLNCDIYAEFLKEIWLFYNKSLKDEHARLVHSNVLSEDWRLLGRQVQANLDIRNHNLSS